MPLFAQMGKAPLVWDPQKDRLAARFNRDGVFSTSDERIAKLLLSQGYQQVTEQEVTSLGLTVPPEGIISTQPLAPGANYQKVEMGKTAPVDGDANDGGLDQSVKPRRTLR